MSADTENVCGLHRCCLVANRANTRDPSQIAGRMKALLFALLLAVALAHPNTPQICDVSVVIRPTVSLSLGSRRHLPSAVVVLYLLVFLFLFVNFARSPNLYSQFLQTSSSSLSQTVQNHAAQQTSA